MWLETVSHNGLDTEVYDLRPAVYTTTTAAAAAAAATAAAATTTTTTLLLISNNYNIKDKFAGFAVVQSPIHWPAPWSGLGSLDNRVFRVAIILYSL